ncbi:MAG: hypothetical protein NZ872_05375 [Archaeoglobaceae archaeon]|nr:hypothetical protein [Archaeoglobaceae archaeon]MDW8128629.1 hypothetical protein [Archaeoglobaceae archaeon]
MRISKNELKSPNKFKKALSDYINSFRIYILENYGISFSEEELGDLMLSACRSNDFETLEKEGRSFKINTNHLENWVYEKLIPNTLLLKLDDVEVIRLLLFCIEMTYQMFSGGTKATITQKGFRERRRTFESILVDQFVGKLDEIFLKKFLESNFKVRVDLDWAISTDIETFRNDILNASDLVSIKTSPTLAGMWAEADKGYDYGIMVKCSIPQQPILQFFIEVCGFKRLLDFAKEKIPSNDETFTEYLERIRSRIREFKCGEIQTELKGFICGYFRTIDYETVKEGTELPYLGVVREERYIVPINELKWRKEEWNEFLKILKF